MIRRDRPILYVDDTVEQRYAMCRMLEREGYRTVQVGTGAEALNALNPELMAIILDVKLPDMTGYEVCRHIKSDSIYGSIPVIQVSASFADPDHRVGGLSGGADAYIAQPVHPQELLNLMRSLINSSQAERMLRFLVQIGPKITRSLDFGQTLRAVRESVVPYFADRCDLFLPLERIAGDAAPPPELLLRQFAEEVMSSNRMEIKAPRSGMSVIGAPLRIAGKLLGAALFVLESGERTYVESDLVYAGDLADRIALALENARLYTAQHAAQEALVRSEKLAAAGRLSAAIAHELNNPLAAITNLLFLIETGDGVPELTRNYAKDALSELARLAHITRQSLGFYRELATAQDFNVSENVQDTLELYSRRLAAKNITVATEYADSLIAHAIQGEIRQVVSNVLLNAFDAMEQGGHLSIRTALSANHEAVISIQDDGPGIPEDIRGRIFEPFFTTKPDTGTGLGLWVSQTIVHNNGGRMELRTMVGGTAHGTTISIVLPRLIERKSI